MLLAVQIVCIFLLQALGGQRDSILSPKICPTEILKHPFYDHEYHLSVAIVKSVQCYNLRLSTVDLDLWGESDDPVNTLSPCPNLWRGDPQKTDV